MLVLPVYVDSVRRLSQQMFHGKFHDIKFYATSIHYQFCWYGEKREQESFILIKLNWHSYLVFNTDNCAMKLCTKTGLTVIPLSSETSYHIDATGLVQSSASVRHGRRSMDAAQTATSRKMVGHGETKTQCTHGSRSRHAARNRDRTVSSRKPAIQPMQL